MASTARPARCEWQWKGDGPAYASPVIATFAAVAAGHHAVALAPRRHSPRPTASCCGSVPFTTAYDQNIVTPDRDRRPGHLLGHRSTADRGPRRAQSDGKWTARPGLAAPSAVPMYMSSAVVSGGYSVRPDASQQGAVLRVDAEIGQGAVDDPRARGRERGADRRRRPADRDDDRRRAGGRAPRSGEVRR